MKHLMIALTAMSLMLSACGSQNVQVNGQKMELEDGTYAKIATNMGDILIKLNTEKAPITAANFIALAEGNHPQVSEEYKGKPFYDGLIFHRVIPDFMIQGGDPQGTGSGGPGYQFTNETNTGLSHVKGAISMANSGPNTNGSQFFITVANTQQLDGNYSVFGSVKAGQSVADSISMVARNNQDRPDEEVKINKVTIIRRGADAKAFDAPTVFTEEIAAMEKVKEEKKAAAKAKLDSMKAQAEITNSGLHYIVREAGEGPKLEEGQTAQVYYAGYLPSGKYFDTNIESIAKQEGLYNKRRPYQPFEVTVGPKGQVIAGWKEALTMMSVGDKYTLLVPPNLGYGARGYGPIPPNSWLIFELQVAGAK